MQEYPIKRGLTKDLETRIVAELRTCFGEEPEKTANGYRIKSGALKRLDVSIGTDGKSVIIDTESDLSASDDVIIDTNKRFRKYLDAITGFSTKERVKRAKSPVETSIPQVACEPCGKDVLEETPCLIPHEKGHPRFWSIFPGHYCLYLEFCCQLLKMTRVPLCSWLRGFQTDPPMLPLHSMNG